jgi:hypothetical protein
MRLHGGDGMNALLEEHGRGSMPMCADFRPAPPAKGHKGRK